MQKVDLAIIGLGVVALAATVLGVVFFDELQGDDDIAFPEASSDLPTRGPEALASGAVAFEWDAPDNATGAELEVTVRLADGSIVVTGGEATVRVVLHGPDGSTAAYVNETWSIGPGAQPGEQTTVTINSTWLRPPASVKGDFDMVDETRTWSEPIHLEVRVEAPSATALPVEQYNFDAEATGSVDTYRAQIQRDEPRGLN